MLSVAFHFVLLFLVFVCETCRVTPAAAWGYSETCESTAIMMILSVCLSVCHSSVALLDGLSNPSQNAVILFVILFEWTE